jgi:diguanylate cyclase (GGDEF)-like protein
MMKNARRIKMTIAIKTINNKLKICPTGNNLPILFFRWYIPYVDKLYNMAILVFISDIIFLLLTIFVSLHFFILFSIVVFTYNNIYIKSLLKRGCYVNTITDFAMLKQNHFFKNENITYEEYKKKHKNIKFDSNSPKFYLYDEITPFFRKKQKIQEEEIKLYDLSYNKSMSDKQLQLIEKNKKLEIAANVDRLTNVYNRHYFEKFVNKELAKSNKECAFIYFDIDNFKKINDSLGGHQSGDLVLHEFGKLLIKEFRNEDILARMGGDEFAVFIKDVPDMKIVKSRLEKLCNKSRKNLNITCSIGIAFYPKNGTTFKELYKEADKAMYAIKNKGKDDFLILK